MDTENVRLHVDITPVAKQKLEELKDRTEAGSLIEVIRRSIALYDLVSLRIQGGEKLFFRDEDGKVQEVIVL